MKELRRQSGIACSVARAGLLLVCLVCHTAFAQMLPDGPPPRDRLIYANATLLSTPALLLTDLRLDYRRRLYRTENLALADNFIGGGISALLTPVGFIEGAHVDFSPTTFFRLSGSVDFYQLLGNLNLMQSFARAEDNWGPKELGRLGKLPAGDPGRNYATSGFSFTGAALLQLKFGPVALRSSNRLRWATFKLREGDRVFYDPILDLAVPNGGWAIASSNQVAYSIGRLLVGLEMFVAQGLYRADDFAPGAQNPNVLAVRLGPIALWRFFEGTRQHFNPALVASVSWFLSHRFRTGVDVSRAIPFAAISFVFWGDVLEVPAAKDR
jgi:hypothetical protein